MAETMTWNQSFRDIPLTSGRLFVVYEDRTGARNIAHVYLDHSHQFHLVETDEPLRHTPVAWAPEPSVNF